MLRLRCEQIRSELSAYHDQELPVADRIAIADHLETCPACEVEADDLLAISEALRTACRTEDVAWMPALARLQSDVLERWDAEEEASLSARIRNLFEDPRRASVCVGVSVIASFCLAMGALVMAQGPVGDPNSLKAIMTQNARMVDIFLPATELPRADAEAVMPAAVINYDEGDESVAFAALVTVDGDLADLEFLDQQPRGRKRPPATHAQLSALLNAAATARFEPARVGGSPVSLNVIWVVTHHTVRAPLQAYVHVTVNGWKML
jgi:putative zinc finger protein